LLVMRRREERPKGASVASRFLVDYCGGVLEGLDWRYVVAAGGGPLAAACAGPFSPTGDIDLFLVGVPSDDAAGVVLAHVEQVVKRAVPDGRVAVVRTAHAVTFVGPPPFRHVQVITRLYSCRAEVLFGFDVDCACVLFDGKHAYASSRSALAILTRVNCVDLTRRSPTYEDRLAKYGARGFRVAVPGFRWSRVNPAVYVGRHRGRGLACLLRLAAGRPQPRHDASDYGSVRLPTGPKCSPVKVVSVVRWCQSRRNCARENRGLPHRHTAVASLSLSGVLQWRCDGCAARAPAEDPMAISGPLTWLRHHPGQQTRVGSFHPVTDDDYSGGAYWDAGVPHLLLGSAAVMRADPAHDERDLGGRTALHVAIWRNEVTLALALLESGASVAAVAHVTRNTCLHEAAQYDRANLLDMLLLFLATEPDADAGTVHATNRAGVTALQLAVLLGHDACVKVLLAHPAVAAQAAATSQMLWECTTPSVCMGLGPSLAGALVEASLSLAGAQGGHIYQCAAAGAPSQRVLAALDPEGYRAGADATRLLQAAPRAAVSDVLVAMSRGMSKQTPQEFLMALASSQCALPCAGRLFLALLALGPQRVNWQLAQEAWDLCEPEDPQSVYTLLVGPFWPYGTLEPAVYAAAQASWKQLLRTHRGGEKTGGAAVTPGPCSDFPDKWPTYALDCYAVVYAQAELEAADPGTLDAFVATHRVAAAKAHVQKQALAHKDARLAAEEAWNVCQYTATRHYYLSLASVIACDLKGPVKGVITPPPEPPHPEGHRRAPAFAQNQPIPEAAPPRLLSAPLHFVGAAGSAVNECTVHAAFEAAWQGDDTALQTALAALGTLPDVLMWEKHSGLTLAHACVVSGGPAVVRVLAAWFAACCGAVEAGRLWSTDTVCPVRFLQPWDVDKAGPLTPLALAVHLDKPAAVAAILQAAPLDAYAAVKLAVALDVPGVLEAVLSTVPAVLDVEWAVSLELGRSLAARTPCKSTMAPTRQWLAAWDVSHRGKWRGSLAHFAAYHGSLAVLRWLASPEFARLLQKLYGRVTADVLAGVVATPDRLAPASSPCNTRSISALSAACAGGHLRAVMDTVGASWGPDVLNRVLTEDDGLLVYAVCFGETELATLVACLPETAAAWALGANKLSACLDVFQSWDHPGARALVAAWYDSDSQRERWRALLMETDATGGTVAHKAIRMKLDNIASVACELCPALASMQDLDGNTPMHLQCGQSWRASWPNLASPENRAWSFENFQGQTPADVAVQTYLSEANKALHGGAGAMLPLVPQCQFVHYLLGLGSGRRPVSAEALSGATVLRNLHSSQGPALPWTWYAIGFPGDGQGTS
jgi:ankyrin repeat protein